MEKPTDIIDSIKSKEDFLGFVGALIQDLKNNPGKWENNTLENYLDALQSWTGSMEQYYINNKLPVPEHVNWRVFADILMAATMYE